MHVRLTRVNQVTKPNTIGTCMCVLEACGIMSYYVIHTVTSF